MTTVTSDVVGLLGHLDVPRVPRQARGRLKRDQILRAALATFGERGYDATSIEAIATRAGTGVGTVYSYFRSKRQILHNLVGLHSEKILALGIGDLDLSTPRASIERVVREAILQDLAFVGMRRACLETLDSDSELADYVATVKREVRAQIAAAIETARLRGEVREGLDSNVTATLVVALIDQLCFLPAASDDATMRAAADMIYHTIFRNN